MIIIIMPDSISVIELSKKIPYARHYNPRFVYFLPSFYIEERFILQTSYVLKIKPKIRGLYTRAVTDQERVIVARVRYSTFDALSK